MTHFVISGSYHDTFCDKQQLAWQFVTSSSYHEAIYDKKQLAWHSLHELEANAEYLSIMPSAYSEYIVHVIHFSLLAALFKVMSLYTHCGTG